MFDMTKQSEIGYKLIIVYDNKLKKYYLTGYTAHNMDYNQVGYSQDGMRLEFDSLESVISNIVDYR